jgi:outer membrane protein assembly factor BamB
VLVLGGEVATIVAFESHTGRPQGQGLKDEASYSSPTTIQLMGYKYVVALTRSRLVFMSTSALGGEQPDSHFPFQPAISASVTAAVPITVSNQIFISASYGLGAVLLQQDYEYALQRIEKLRERTKPGEIVDLYYGIDARDLKVIWRNDTSLSCHYSTPVHREGFLYGLHGRHDLPGGTELRCVEWATGKVRWSKPGLSGANVLLARDSLLVLTEKGELIRAEAKPDGYRELARAQILGSGVRAYPALANGRLYARDKRQLVCVDLRR